MNEDKGTKIKASFSLPAPLSPIGNDNSGSKLLDAKQSRSQTTPIPKEGDDRKWKVYKDSLEAFNTQKKKDIKTKQLLTYQAKYIHHIMQKFGTAKEEPKETPPQNSQRNTISFQLPLLNIGYTNVQTVESLSELEIDYETVSSPSLIGRSMTVSSFLDEPKVESPKEQRKPKAKWHPDNEKARCPICFNLFTPLNRRHHCRKCGSVICGRCSTQYVALEEYGYVGPQRVCDHCFIKITHPFERSSIESTTAGHHNDLGLSHTFELKYFPAPTNCNYCDSLIIDVGAYICKDCKYSAHKKCCPLVPNTCASKDTMKKEGIQMDRAHIEQIHMLWKEYGYHETGVNSSNFMKFYNNCVIPQISNYPETVLIKLQDNEIFRMFRYINLSNSGKISFEEYAVFVSRVEKYQPEEQIKLTFAIIDTDGDGMIPISDLSSYLSRNQKANTVFGEIGESFADTVAEGIFETCGVDLKALLSREKIIEGYKKDPSLLSKFCGV